MGIEWSRLGEAAWKPGMLCLVVLALLPLMGLVVVALRPTEGIWGHLWQTLLPRYVWTSLLLAFLVAMGCLLLGVSSAWLVSMCHFRGRGILSTALLLPLAMPGYLAAFVYTELLDYTGPVQRGLRAVFGWEDASAYWFPEVRGILGAAVFLSITLYPYVFLLARTAFVKQYARVFEAGRSLGGSPWRCFWTLSLPLARPAIAAGAALAVMEALSDFGVVELFAVPTFTVGVYRVWFAMGNAPAAAQLAMLPLGVLLLLGWQLARLRRSQPLYALGLTDKIQPPFVLSPIRQLVAVVFCVLPVLLGFLLPSIALLWEAAAQFSLQLTSSLTNSLSAASEVLQLVANSLLLSSASVLICTISGGLLAFGVHLHPQGWRRFAHALVRLGYATPGVVLAIGILLPLAFLDNAITAVSHSIGFQQPWLISGSLLAVLLAYYARFLSISTAAFHSGLSRLDTKLLHAARSLGAGPLTTFWKIHRPILQYTLLSAALLVFIDSMKELPLTLILRPFNFDTLPTRIFEYASTESFSPAATSALILIIINTIPTLLLLHKNPSLNK